MENFSKLIYSGEIITDANDDSKTYKYTYINSYSSHSGEDAYQSAISYSGYNYYENRNVGLVTVSSAK